MKITIENTTQITHVNDVPCRLWEGTTESGIRVECLITRIAAIADKNDLTQFERELQEQRAPSAEARAFPLRMIL